MTVGSQVCRWIFIKYKSFLKTLSVFVVCCSDLKPHSTHCLSSAKYLEPTRGLLKSVLFTQVHLIHVSNKMPNQAEAFPVYASSLLKKKIWNFKCLWQRDRMKSESILLPNSQWWGPNKQDILSWFASFLLQSGQEKEGCVCVFCLYSSRCFWGSAVCVGADLCTSLHSSTPETVPHWGDWVTAAQNQKQLLEEFDI